jgi:hypothetical protein
MAAGLNAPRGSGPNRSHALKSALTQTGSPDPGTTVSALRRHALANSLKLLVYPAAGSFLERLRADHHGPGHARNSRCRRSTVDYATYSKLDGGQLLTFACLTVFVNLAALHQRLAVQCKARNVLPHASPPK